jgi:hypothetical protein
MERRLTPEGVARQRQMAAMSISAAVLLVLLGIVLGLTLTKAAPGLVAIVLGGCGVLLWAFLLPRYWRRGLI